MLERRVVDARPPRVEYTLTPEGRRLQAVVDALDGYAGHESGVSLIVPREAGVAAQPDARRQAL